MRFTVVSESELASILEAISVRVFAFTNGCLETFRGKDAALCLYASVRDLAQGKQLARKGLNAAFPGFLIASKW